MNARRSCVAWLVLACWAAPASADSLMRDCEPNRSRGTMQCVKRNGVCADVRIDGQQTRPISREQRRRISALPGMREVCWQLDAPVSARFRVEARGGGVVPDYIGPLQQLGGLLVPLDDYDPEFDSRRIEPLRGYGLEADGYRDGSWQMRQQPFLMTPGNRIEAGEYVLVLRLRGRDNWDRQEILLRIDPDLEPPPPNPGTPPGAASGSR